MDEQPALVLDLIDGDGDGDPVQVSCYTNGTISYLWLRAAEYPSDPLRWSKERRQAERLDWGIPIVPLIDAAFETLGVKVDG